MSDGFSADWLALREPYDHAARADALTGRLAAWLAREAASRPVRIVDLGCGTGSNLRYLSPRLRVPQAWSLVDHDADLLAQVPAMPGLETVRADLSGPLDALPIQAAALVTGSALLDLVSDDWLARLAAAAIRPAAAARPAFLFVLSYDGDMRWDRPLPGDDHFLSLFNRHQTTDKGFGIALGPAATGRLAERLEAAGYRLWQASTPWRLGVADARIQRDVVTGAVAALATTFPAEAGPLADWLERRLDRIAAGQSGLIVGHRDLLALPA